MFIYNGSKWMGQQWNGSGWNKLVSSSGSFSFAPVFGDFNADGKDELLLRTSSYYYLFQLSGSTFKVVGGSTSGSWRSATSDKIAVGDFDSDGADEVFVSNATGAQLLDYSSGTGRWSTTKSWTTKIGSASSWTLSSADVLQAGDFDGDGYSELFVSNGSTATLLDDARSWTKLWPSSSTSSASLSTLWTVSASDQWMAADFDGDGADSLMVVNNTKAVMMDYASASWTSAWSVSTGLTFWWSMNSSDRWLSHDVDGDGRAELQSFSGSASHLMFYLN
jgi:hypothetical protein